MKLEDALLQQAAACGKLGSPFMDRLLTIAAAKLDRTTAVGVRLLDWEGDLGPTKDSVPLRFAGALHALKLMGNAALAAAYPPNQVSDATLWQAVSAAMSENEAFILTFLNSAPQTNEVRRSASLICAASLVSSVTGLPLGLIELGASAGLNLNFDKFALDTPDGKIGVTSPALTLDPDWFGDRAPHGNLNVAWRKGCDLSPIDPSKAKDQLRLLSYLWADQPHRIELTKAAISVANTKVIKADALQFLTDELTPAPGVVRFLFHTVAWQYFPKSVQDECTNIIQAEGTAATDQSPLAWFSMEAGASLKGANLRLRLWPGNLDLDLGQCDFHGRWLNWKRPDIYGA